MLPGPGLPLWIWGPAVPQHLLYPQGVPSRGDCWVGYKAGLGTRFWVGGAVSELCQTQARCPCPCLRVLSTNVRGQGPCRAPQGWGHWRGVAGAAALVLVHGAGMWGGVTCFGPDISQGSLGCCTRADQSQASLPWSSPGLHPAELPLPRELLAQHSQRGARSTFQTFPSHVVELCLTLAPWLRQHRWGALALH